jgi:Response regulator containing CheY-like receiver domain and AraC-type DNA-binding domain
VLALQQELGELGYEIAGNASTAAEALRVAEDNRADLVLMDIQLDGGISGIAAAAAIRGHLDIPVVFLTAHASAETVGRAVESGAFGYLLKPYTVAGIESGDRHRAPQTQHGNRDAPGAQFTVAGRCGTTSIHLSSPTAETDCAKRALQVRSKIV